MPRTELGPAIGRESKEADFEICRSTLIGLNTRGWFLFLLAHEQFYSKFTHRIDGVAAAARVVTKIGTNKTHQWLFERACPGPVDYEHAAWLHFETWWVQNYWGRWKHASQCLGDLRLNGKIRLRPDVTYAAAAAGGLESSLVRLIDSQDRVLRKLRFDCFAPLRLRVKGMVPGGQLMVAQHPWLFADHGYLPFHTLAPARRYIPENIYWTRKNRVPVSHYVVLNEVISEDAVKASNERDRFPAPRRKNPQLNREEEAALFAAIAIRSSMLVRWPETFFGLSLLMELLAWLLRAREVLLAAHIWLVRAVASKQRGRDEFGDMINEGIFGLNEALVAFKPQKGIRFRTFAWRPVNHRIQDYLREQQRLKRPWSSDAIVASGNDRALGLYASNGARQEDEYKIISDAWGK